MNLRGGIFTWISPEQVLSRLIIGEDEQGERQGRQPPVELRMFTLMRMQSVSSYLQRIHAEPLVHARAIGEEGGQEGFEAEPKVEHPVLHPLLEHRVLPRLADDQVGPLDDHDGDEEGGVARVLQDLAVPVSDNCWSGFQQQKC